MLTETLISEFLADGKYRKLASRTTQIYSLVLKSFASYLQSCGIAGIEDVSSNTLKSYALYLQEQGNNSGGIAFKFRVIRALFGYAGREEISNQNPFKRFRMPKVEYPVMAYVEFDEYEALVAAAREGSKYLRDVAVISVLYDTGIRVGELLGLNLEDLLSDRGMLKVRGKTGERLVPISRHVLRRVQQYINSERPKTLLREVFLSSGEAPMNYHSVKLTIQRCAHRAKIPYKSPHCFRRGFATRLILNGADVFSLQRILGHTTLTMSSRYAVLNEESLKQVHMAAAPTRR